MNKLSSQAEANLARRTAELKGVHSDGLLDSLNYHGDEEGIGVCILHYPYRRGNYLAEKDSREFGNY